MFRRGIVAELGPESDARCARLSGSVTFGFPPRAMEVQPFASFLDESRAAHTHGMMPICGIPTLVRCILGFMEADFCNELLVVQHQYSQDLQDSVMRPAASIRDTHMTR